MLFISLLCVCVFVYCDSLNAISTHKLIWQIAPLGACVRACVRACVCERDADQIKSCKTR